MRTLALFCSSLVFALVVCAAPALASDWGLDTFKKQSASSDWEGFGVGTSFTEKVESSSPMGSMTTETRKTLVKIEADKFTIKVETKSPMTGGKWVARESTEKRKKDVKFATKDGGEETLTIGDKTYPCKKVHGTKTENGRSDNMTFWIHATHGVMQMQGTAPNGQKYTTTVSKLSAERKIGDATFKCREYVGNPSGGKLKLVIALNSPAHTLLQHYSGKHNGMDVAQKTEVTAVTIKKPTPVTAK